MPTVYHRLNAFYKIDKFRFKERDKKKIGLRLSALWRELHPEEKLPTIESVEDSGVYRVFDYPESFVSIIDQLIRNIHKEILDASREHRRLKEIAEHPTTSPPVTSPAPLAPLPKIRKRIPAKKIPAWKSR